MPETPDTIEINSLSVQPANIKDPKSIIIPQYVTEGMLERGKEALSKVSEVFPNENLGLSLHLGAVISPKPIVESGIPITSIDTPSTAYPTETVQKIISRPSQVLDHVAWRLNSALGFTKDQAEENRLKVLIGAENMSPFGDTPFLRLSLGEDTERLLRGVPQNWSVAVEYDSENGFSLDQYITTIKKLRTQGIHNVGISLDPAHIFEYFRINEGRSANAEEGTMNFVTNMMRDPKAVPVLSVDVNNIGRGAETYGQTHDVFSEDLAINIQAIIEEYKEYLSGNNKEGRLCLEFSPRDYNLFVGEKGSLLLSKIKSFSR